MPRAPFDPIPVPSLLMSAVALFPSDPRLTLTRFLSHHRVPFRRSGAVTEARLPGGGTARAMCELVEKAGGHVVGCTFLVELAFLGGRAKLAPHEVRSLIVYEDE